MNGVISLCTFCEVHGPRILLTTQPYHCAGRNPLDYMEQDAGQMLHDLEFALTISYRAMLGDDDYDDLLLNEEMEDDLNSNFSTNDKDDGDYFNDNDHGNIMRNGSSNSGGGGDGNQNKDDAAARKKKINELRNSKRKNIVEESSCPGCGWTCVQTGFVSHDNETKTLFVTRHRPQRPEVHQILQHACVRALSAEVGSRGPIVFGDNTNGYAFSYSFNLHDPHARGQKRQYSFIFLMSDQVHLVSSFMFLKQHFSVLIHDLIQRATSVQRKPRGSVHSFRRNLSFDRFRSMRHVRDLTSLCDHLEEPDLYSQIHSYCTWLLKGVAMRLFERTLEGPSLIGVTFDAESTYPTMSLSDLYAGLGEQKFSTLIQNITIGNQCVIVCDNQAIGDDIASLLGVLLPKRCLNLLLSQEKYVESYVCNILSLLSSASLPEPLNEHVVVLRVVVDEEKMGFKLRQNTGNKEVEEEEEEEKQSLLDRIVSVDAFFEEAIQAAKMKDSIPFYDDDDDDVQDTDNYEAREKDKCDVGEATIHNVEPVCEQEIGNGKNKMIPVEGKKEMCTPRNSNMLDNETKYIEASGNNDNGNGNDNSYDHDGDDGDTNGNKVRRPTPPLQQKSDNSILGLAQHRQWKSDIVESPCSIPHPLIPTRSTSSSTSTIATTKTLPSSKRLSVSSNSTSNIPVARRRGISRDDFSLDDVPQRNPRKLGIDEPAFKSWSSDNSNSTDHDHASVADKLGEKEEIIKHEEDDNDCEMSRETTEQFFSCEPSVVYDRDHTNSLRTSSEHNFDDIWDNSSCNNNNNATNLSTTTHAIPAYLPSSCALSLTYSTKHDEGLNSYANDLVAMATRQASIDMMLQWVLTLREKYTQLAKTLFSLTRAHSLDAKNAIFMLGLSEDDLPLLMFLMSALSRPHRVKLLQQRH
eukprot:m.29120 g.29120  ORF g.29120 m.29120 type:complete len:916 (+) comp6121_c1_seq2:317-3064(+)